MPGNIRVIAPLVYGALIAVLAILHVPSLGLIAVIGAVLLALMFVVLASGNRGTRADGTRADGGAGRTRPGRTRTGG